MPPCQAGVVLDPGDAARPHDESLDTDRYGWSKGCKSPHTGFALSKALALIILAVMALHLFKPLGLPGLRKRRDVWKIAVFALVAMGATVLLSHTTE